MPPTRSHLYSSGMISTADSFRFVHGIAAARVRFDKRPGQHGAFWLQTNEPNDTEIDVVESFGRASRPLSVTLHQANDNETESFRYKPELSDLGPNASTGSTTSTSTPWNGKERVRISHRRP